MENKKKDRANEYEEKLSFNGSLDDLINESIRHADKYKEGDTIEENGIKVLIIATKGSKEYDIPEGFNYVVEDLATKKKYFIK